MNVQLLSVPTCAECTTEMSMLHRLQADYPELHVERVDSTKHSEHAERYGLLSFEYDLLDTQALVIDGELALTGHCSQTQPETAVRDWLNRRFAVSIARSNFAGTVSVE